MTYKIFFEPKTFSELKKFDKHLKIQILKKVKQLEQNPEIGKPLGNVLKNQRSLHIGKFRVLYTVKGQDIIIAKIKHRKHIYD